MHLMTMKFLGRIKKWFRVKKIYLTNSLYKLIGTRYKVLDITEDLPNTDEIWREFSILFDIWELTNFKKDTLSKNRLEACVRAFIKLKGGDYKCPPDKLQETIEKVYFEKIDLYEDSLMYDNEELPCIAEGAAGDVARNFLLLEYMFKKEIEQA